MHTEGGLATRYTKRDMREWAKATRYSPNIPGLLSVANYELGQRIVSRAVEDMPAMSQAKISRSFSRLITAN